MAGVGAKNVIGSDRSASDRTDQEHGWGAVFALTLCVGTLIASEFMPVSLLTPIAADLHMTEGNAGQAIAVSGIFAVLTSLGISQVIRGMDRRKVLLALTVLMIASGLMVAFAPNAAVFMTGRAIVGVVIGGFWSMSAATVMRLVPKAEVPRALGMLNGGNALATTIAAPLGSFLGQYIGWRGAFFCVVPLAALTLVWQFATLPSMPQTSTARKGTVFRVLRRQQVPFGMLAVALFFMGQFALYTYLRPFLETVPRVDVSTLSLILLVIGFAGLLGTYVIGFLLRTRLYSLLILMPLAMAAIGVALCLFGGSTVTVTALLAGWGLIGTAAPVGWWTWLSKVLPDDAEAGGGLMVAVIQLAIALGATVGGFAFDMSGYRSAFVLSAVVLSISAVIAALAWRSSQKRFARESCRHRRRAMATHPETLLEGDDHMLATMLYGPRDIRCEEVAEPKIQKPTDAIIRLSATCICGSDLWPFRGLNAINAPMAMGHEYCGVVEEVGSAVTTRASGPVRRRLLLPLRQYLPALPLRLSVLLRAARIHERRASAARAGSARRRHAGRDARDARRRFDPELSRRVGRARHRLVRGRRGARAGRLDRRRRRRRRGRPHGRARRQTDGRGAHHRHEPPQEPPGPRARIWRDRHRLRARRGGRRPRQGADERRRRGFRARMRRHAGIHDAGAAMRAAGRDDRLCRRAARRRVRRRAALLLAARPHGRPGSRAPFPAAPHGFGARNAGSIRARCSI